ncbi:MAG: hypothetical protein IPH10_10420 [bacterium]|nr:hypothetical protein [bacterium]
MDDSLKVTEEEYLSHTLSIRTPPQGSWDVHVNMTIMTDVLLKKIGYREDSGLGQLIHNLRWHQGLDPLLWIHENAELASKISKTYLSVPPGYAKLIRESIEILKDR